MCKTEKIFRRFLRMQGASSEQKWNSQKDAPMTGMPFAVKDRTLKTLYFQAAERPSESVWHGGRMTVPVCVRIRHFTDFVLYLIYQKGSQYVQKIYPG